MINIYIHTKYIYLLSLSSSLRSMKRTRLHDERFKKTPSFLGCLVNIYRFYWLVLLRNAGTNFRILKYQPTERLNGILKQPYRIEYTCIYCIFQPLLYFLKPPRYGLVDKENYFPDLLSRGEAGYIRFHFLILHRLCCCCAVIGLQGYQT